MTPGNPSAGPTRGANARAGRDAAGAAAAAGSGWRAAVAIFVFSLVVYNLNLRWIGALDSRPARFLPVSLLTTGTLHLDRFQPILPTNPLESYWYTRAPSGHLVSIYPVLTPVLVAPLFVPAAVLLERQGQPTAGFLLLTEVSEKIGASLIAAASVVLMFWLLRRVAGTATAILLTVAYAFATETWMIGSQALWQHGTSELLLAALLLALLRPTPGSVAVAGLLSGLLVANRPPNLLFAAAATLLVARHQRGSLAAFLSGAAAVAAVLLAYNLPHFHNLVGGYALAVSTEVFHRPFDPAFFAGLVGLLASPGRGLLVFSPFFLFLFASVRRPAADDLRRLLRYFGPAAGLQLMVFAAFVTWTAGACYGPRYLTDMLPILILALVPAVESLRRRVLWWVFAALVGFGVWVQAVGAWCYPMGGSAMDENVWSLSHVQYVMEWKGGLAPERFLHAWRDTNWSAPAR
jgi:hypothetical protein